jgi:hypothetical protein
VRYELSNGSTSRHRANIGSNARAMRILSSCRAPLAASHIAVDLQVFFSISQSNLEMLDYHRRRRAMLEPMPVSNRRPTEHISVVEMRGSEACRPICRQPTTPLHKPTPIDHATRIDRLVNTNAIDEKLSKNTYSSGRQSRSDDTKRFDQLLHCFDR